MKILCESLQIKDDKIVRDAAAAWKKERSRAFIKGCLFALLSIAVLAVVYCSLQWFSTADENDLGALARQAAHYLDYDELSIEEVRQRGNYLSALCTAADGNWCMCVFERDSLFKGRWRANGGSKGIKDGKLTSWNYGSPQKEAVLIFCGGNIPDEVCWYKFQNNNITYICPVEHDKLLDIFIIPDGSHNINGYPIPLDCNQQEIK